MKTNQFRAMVFALLMAVISLATVSAQAITVSGTVTDAKDGTPLVGCFQFYHTTFGEKLFDRRTYKEGTRTDARMYACIDRKR